MSQSLIDMSYRHERMRSTPATPAVLPRPTPARPVQISTKTAPAGGPSGSAPVAVSKITVAGPATLPAKPKFKGIFAALQLRDWFRVHAPDKAAAMDARFKAVRESEFLPGGKTVRGHWREWVAAVAKGEGISEAEVMAAFDGEAVLSSKAADGDNARTELCGTAWKVFPELKI